MNISPVKRNLITVKDLERFITLSRRLAGKAAKRREFDDMKIIDINEDQMRGDPNVWLTKVVILMKCGIFMNINIILLTSFIKLIPRKKLAFEH